MGIKYITINFKYLSVDTKMGLKDYSLLYKTGTALKKLLLDKDVQNNIKSGRTPSRFNNKYWNGSYDFLTMIDVDTLTFSLNPFCVNKITNLAIKEDRSLYQAKKNSLLISNAMTLGLCFIVDRPIFINQNVFEINIDEKLANKKFLLWYFNIIIKPLFQKIYTSKYLSKEELGRIKIPIIKKSEQDQIVAKIEPLEAKLKKLKKLKNQPHEIINKIFARDFGFDLEKYKKIQRKNFFDTRLSDIKTSLIRSTVIQNKPSTIYLKKFFNSKTIFLKHLLKKPIRRGKQPIYTNDGNKVIKTLNIQNGKINLDDVQYVSEKYLKTNKDKAAIYQYDLLLTSTGMGRGKFALYTDEELCFADSHVSIIRFNHEKINPYFLNYYCQSLFGTEQLKYIEMHIKGTPEIYEGQLNYFQIPKISLEKQQNIVDKIKAEIDKQEVIKKQIETERNKIDEIIENAVK